MDNQCDTSLKQTGRPLLVSSVMSLTAQFLAI